MNPDHMPRNEQRSGGRSPCQFHDGDTEACETYSGQVPCEPETEEVLLQRLEERDADCARVAAENAQLWEEVQALRRVEGERDAAIAHVGECRAVLYRIVDIWDGPLYKHEMLPAITKAREVLKGGE